MKKNIQIPVKNICKFNIVKYDRSEDGIVSISYPLIGIINSNNKCYDLINNKTYPIIYNENIVNNNYSKNLYASIVDIPFKNMDEVINIDYILENISKKNKNIDNIKLFDENRICRFKYKKDNNKITSIGYISSMVDGNIYDLINKEMIENDNIYHRNIPFSNSDLLVSNNQIKNILKLRRDKQK